MNMPAMVIHTLKKLFSPELIYLGAETESAATTCYKGGPLRKTERERAGPQHSAK